MPFPQWTPGSCFYRIAGLRHEGELYIFFPRRKRPSSGKLQSISSPDVHDSPMICESREISVCDEIRAVSLLRGMFAGGGVLLGR